MTCVDAFILSVPKDQIDTYRGTLSASAELWKEFGALSYVECLADDVPYGKLTSFPRAVQAREDDVVILSWVTWSSRSDRDAGNKKVMSDPRMIKLMENLPVDGDKMIFGGFETMIEI